MMFKKINTTKLFVALSLSICFSQAAVAQRAITTIERNKDAHEINELYKQGKWDDGRKIADYVLKKNPKDSDMRMLIGKYYIHRRDYNRARYELVKSLEYAPANVESKHMLVTVETETKRYSSAICYVNELLEVNPYWKGLWRKKIALYRDMGNHVEADRLLKRISQIYPEDAELKRDQAYLSQQRQLQIKKEGKIDQSIESLRKMVDEQPTHFDNYLPLIDSYIKSGDYNSALIYSDRGLNQFPGSGILIQKKISILDHELRYPEILTLIDQQINKGYGDQRLIRQRDYFLKEAARNAKNNDPAVFYGKIFEGSPNNKEAFGYVFNDLLSKGQGEEALRVLNKHRRSVGQSKKLDLLELTAFKKMGNEGKVNELTKVFFNKYPGDTDLKESFVNISLREARENMVDNNVAEAILDWKQAIQFGDTESVRTAQRGLFNAYMSIGRYTEAMGTLDDILLDNPNDPDLLLKKSDIYLKQGAYDLSLDIFEKVLANLVSEDRERYIEGYSEIIAPIVKELRDDYKLPEAQQLVRRWLAVDLKNQEALLSMINICYQLKDQKEMLRYAQIAEQQYGDDMTFKIKLAEALNQDSTQVLSAWNLLHGQVQKSPYHEPLVNTFSHTTEIYAGQLLKQKEHKTALTVIDTALYYKENKTLKHMKGLAFEGLREFDSAYYYQKFYEPTLMEYDDFKDHLNYLGHRALKNYVAISHLRARFGDDNKISSISSLDYGRLAYDGSSYVGRIHYTGREEGKGIQGQFEWTKPWTPKFSTRMDIALANNYFAKIAVNAAGFYEWIPSWEAEVGIGYRRFFSGQNLFNINLGLTKELEDVRLGLKMNNYLLDYEGERIHLYSIAGKVQYFMNSRRNYLLGTASIGNAPDTDLLNNQLYNSFNVFNAMVGAGVGRSFTKNVSASVMGSWYNFQTGGTINSGIYKNLYNLYFQVHVSF